MFEPGTKPKGFVFVVMPFREEFRDLLELCVRPACTACGVFCESAEEQIGVGDILERIYNQIHRSDVVVAIMTGMNPNVFYEVGYAHALNKRVILLTQTAEDIPFDLKHTPHVIYGAKLAQLQGQLEARIRWCLENPEAALSSVDLNPEVYLGGTRLDSSQPTPIRIVPQYWDNRTLGGRYWNDRDLRDALNSCRSALVTSLGFHNPLPVVMSLANYRVAVAATKGLPLLPLDAVRSVTRLPNDRYRFAIQLSESDSLYPDDWTSAELVFGFDRAALVRPEDRELVIRTSTPVGVRDFTAVIEVDPPLQDSGGDR